MSVYCIHVQCTYVCTNIGTSVAIYGTYMYVCVYACMYICRYVCMYVRMYVCMYVCTYVCMHVCTYVCMNILIFMQMELTFLDSIAQYTWKQCGMSH